MDKKKEYLRKLLKQMNYKLINGTSEIYEKKYNDKNNYYIQVDFEKEYINYETIDKENSINVCSKNTTNFSQNENFVVLECVDRLLEKGYEASSIDLERSWSSGHGTSGRLDILLNKDGVPYLMIECKTYGAEYKKEKNNMLKASKNGDPKGQLFSYYIQEKTVEYLCLYASELDTDKIKYENAIIEVDELWSTLSNQKILFNSWNKMFKYNGIFEMNVKPYNIECKALIRGDLKKLTDKDSSRIFNQFLEILRHNSVSDKPNAFNKILNLFICKIIDEDRSDDEELLFQWTDETTYITLQSNLEDLYTQGMDKFLDIQVTDYSDNEIDKKLAILSANEKIEIKKMFQELRLQKNPEFAFKEVYNDESFIENAKVLKEVVKLLQPFKFRYGHKQQFLGNFFELLLNTSIKQESGQFFTPVPIARFMISSLPIKEKIDRKVTENSRDLLPVAVDYACGSGHFLTEYMDIVQMVINSYDTAQLRKSIKNTFEKWKQFDDENLLQGEFEWAKDYVYGIEKDYRLVKTSKISTFLNGDGDANIIHSDGLDKFSSDNYKGHLKSNSSNNKNFDFVIANPPYSVSLFKQTLESDSSDFELFDLISENSSEIECLFVERTSQLLKDDGCAAIILPSSILTNSNELTAKTKEIILRNFHIKAISKMGSNTFMATGTNTIILFLSKRSDGEYKIAEKIIYDFMKSFVDFSYEGTKHIISKYVASYFDKFKLDDYISLLSRTPTDLALASEYYNDLKEVLHKSKNYKSVVTKKAHKELSEDERKVLEDGLFHELLIEIETNKLIYYILTFADKTLLVNTGEKQAEKDFLGYEFSKRRGSEGIHYLTNEDGTLVSSLYDEDDLFSNDEKVNYYIRCSFNNEYPQISENLKNNIKLINTSELIRFDNLPFDLTMMLEPSVNITIDSRYDNDRIGKLCFVQKGSTITQKQTKQGDIPVVAGGKEPAYYHDSSNREAGAITVSASGANAGYVNYWKEPIFASDCSTIISKDETVLKTKYVYVLLTKHQEEIYKLQKGQGQPHVYPEDLSKIKIPIPPIDIQGEIIKNRIECNDSIEELKENITNLKGEINDKVNDFFGTVHKSERLGKLALISRGASPRPIRKYLTKDQEGVNWIKIGDVKPKDKYIVSTKQKITKTGAEKSVRVKKGDFIISNSMSVGRPYIVDIDGCIHDGWLLVSEISDEILTDYLFYVLSSEYTQNQFINKAVGSVVENLNIERVEKIIIPLPDKPTQENFLSEVYKLEDKIANMELEIESKIIEEGNIMTGLLYGEI